MALKGVAARKGGIATGLPNKKFRDKFDDIFRKKVMEVCKVCGHDMCYCTCKESLSQQDFDHIWSGEFEPVEEK